MHAFAFEREAKLSEHSRPDFLATPGVCIEVKMQGAVAEVRRQLTRYAEHDKVRVIVKAVNVLLVKE